LLFLKESRGLLREGIDVKFGFIAKHSGWKVGCARRLGVSGGGFYGLNGLQLERSENQRLQAEHARDFAVRSRAGGTQSSPDCDRESGSFRSSKQSYGDPQAGIPIEDIRRTIDP
jgi:hypothetical protein